MRACVVFRPRPAVAVVGVLCAAAIAVALDTRPVIAQQIEATSAYVTEAPNNPLWLALATPDGRWAIQLVDGCTAIATDMNVRVSGGLDDPRVQLVSEDGESCGLATVVHMGTTPCAHNDLGQCDVRNS